MPTSTRTELSPSSSSRAGWRLRFVWPLIIVLAATAVWQISGRQAARQGEAIRTYVHLTCVDAVGGRLDAAGIKAAGPFLRQAVGDALVKALGDPPATADQIGVEVTPGDDAEHGDGSATHTAMISARGSPRLGLRVIHGSGSDNFSIIGYWIP